MLEQLAKAVVVGFVDDNQPHVVKDDVVVIEAVVEGFDHGDVAPVVFVLVQDLDFGIDDFVFDADVREHPAGLTQQFNPVGQDEDFLTAL